MSLTYSTAYVALATNNFEQTIAFYRQLLSQDPNPYQPGNYAEFQLLGLRLGIFQPKTDHQEEFKGSLRSRMSLCLEVVNLDEAIAVLTEMGYAPSGSINIASHGKEIYVYDPDGNRLILHQSS